MSLGSPTFTKIVHVDSDGSDSTGNGSYENPFLTVGHAMASITDASRSKNYSILMGSMADASNIALKPFVWISGAGPDNSQLSGALSFDASWGTHLPSQPLGGFLNLSFNQFAPAIDFSSVTPFWPGQVTFVGCTINGAIVFTGYTSNDFVVLQNCRLTQGYTQNGLVVELLDTACENSQPITVNSSAGGHNSRLLAIGGGTDGSITCVESGGSINCDLSGFGVDNTVTLNGANIVFTSTTQPRAVSLLSGAQAPVIGGSITSKTTVVASAGPYTITSYDYMVAVQYTDTGAISINLPDIVDVGEGRTLVIIDSGYGAGANNITLVQAVGNKINNNASNYVLNLNGTSIWLRANQQNLNWEIIALYPQSAS